VIRCPPMNPMPSPLAYVTNEEADPLHSSSGAKRSVDRVCHTRPYGRCRRGQRSSGKRDATTALPICVRPARKLLGAGHPMSVIINRISATVEGQRHVQLVSPTRCPFWRDRRLDV
jgi:hypothetical protein